MFFEQGPIRPPSEAGSLLLRFTRNCPWNQCRFCPVYKGQPFSRRSLEEIRGDIDAVHAIIEDLRQLSLKMGQGGEITGEVVNAVLTDPERQGCDRHVAYWAYSGKGTVFIQDANSLLLDTGVLVEALSYLREKVPGVTRVTSYARSQTLSRKSLEELKALRAAGLDRLHIGMESGSDAVLAFMRKGATAAQHIDAGVKVVEAGISLSEYIMPGLGGKEWTREHAIETARVLNAIDPQFIRLRSLRIPPQVPLHEDVEAGRFLPLSDDETVQEIRLLVDSLHGIHSTLTSDHIMNLLEEVAGKLPEDKDSMLAVIDRYLALPPEEKLLFRLGRRGGALRALDELKDPHVHRRLEAAMHDLGLQTGGDLEKVISELGDRYI
ncbi:MAG: radical SAM protein [Syntrophobacteraceae bacterium]